MPCWTDRTRESRPRPLSPCRHAYGRCAAHLGEAGNGGPRPAASDVDREVDIGEYRLMHLLHHRSKHRPNGSGGRGVLAAEDAKKRLPLLRRSPRVDDQNPLTLALMDGT